MSASGSNPRGSNDTPPATPLTPRSGFNTNCDVRRLLSDALVRYMGTNWQAARYKAGRIYYESIADFEFKDTPQGERAKLIAKELGDLYKNTAYPDAKNSAVSNQDAFKQIVGVSLDEAIKAEKTHRADLDNSRWTFNRRAHSTFARLFYRALEPFMKENTDLKLEKKMNTLGALLAPRTVRTSV